ncbi:MAG: CocE/NonD family hydrolase [Caulobacteraceae bacterium]
MKNANLKEERFAFYRSGCHSTDFIFTGNGVTWSNKDVGTGKWPPFESFDMKADMFDKLIPVIWHCLSEADAKDWSHSNEVAFSSGVEYQRYMKLEGTVDGSKAEAWIWAMQGKGLPLDIIVCGDTITAFVMTARDRCNVLVKPGYEALTPLRLWDDPLLSKDEYNVKHIGTHFVKTGDGASLATDVWLPLTPGDSKKFPSVLIRTPYGRFSNLEFWLRFVRRGYALVVQDVRGRDDSDGEWIPYKYDKSDGDETLNWIAAQTWSDGNVGMTGASYLGNVQWAAAASGNPHLKALFSMVTSGPAFIDIERRGGIYSSGSLAWAFMMADRRSNREALKRSDWNEVAAIRPIRDIPQRALGKNIHFWDEYMKHPDNDEFWQRVNWSLDSDKIDVPSIVVSGWYDDNGMGSSSAWEMNEKNKRANQKLVFGPWYHQFNSTREIHGVRFGNNSIRYDLDVLCLRWFDKFLKGIDNGVEKEPAVQYYLVGSNEWAASRKWTPENACYKNIYLHSKGNARTSSGNGALKSAPGTAEPYDSYVFNPEDPAPFLIDVSENEMNVPGNYKEVDIREDVLVYDSDVLTEAVSIAGNVYAEIYAASSAKDTDWLVRLEDVDAEGNPIRLTDGILRARYRKSFEKAELLEPGKIERYEIRMAKIANTFKEGHKIRVTITSGAKNLAFPNHNTGNNPPDDVEMICAEQKIYHDEQHPSHVKLPVVKGSL